jgi:UDP-2-acetamido-2,6-beta-L-arabino-hexul-4-ose reductase
MPAVVSIEDVPLHRDTRGWVFEPVEPERFPTQRNAHLVLSEPGAIRGNHYHVRGTEVVVVMGPALVRYREETEVRDVAVPDGKAIRFTFPPGVPHAIQNTGRQATLMIAFNTELHERANPDVVREELIVPPAIGQ